MEEPVLSDEETSDSEVIFVGNSPPHPEVGGKRGPSKVVTEEMRIDEQLKELGLFEEGMSMEQKQELLVVLAASRETAEQEESMRQKAIEWERRLFSDVDDISPYDASNEDDHWKSDSSKTTPAAYGRNNLPVTEVNKGAKCLTVNKAEESYSQKVKITEKAFKMLDVEESSKASESQDQKSMNASTISADLFYSHSSGDSSFTVSGNSQRRPGEGGQRGKHHLSRSAYSPLSPSSSKVAVAHPIIRDSGNEMVLREDDSSTLSPVDFQRIKYKLEKSLSSWEPCTSPVAFDLVCRRASPKNNADSEYVPFFCPENCDPKEYTTVILNSLRKFHRLLRKVQARSKARIQWGEPVKVGRHHLDSLDALTPRHQVKVRNSDRMAPRLSNRSNVEVSYAELESKECNEDAAMMNIDKCPDPNSSDSNSVVRTLKSAFRPIKTPLQLIDKRSDLVAIDDYELHDNNECSKSDTLPRSKSCPSPVASDSNTGAELVERSKRILLSTSSDSKQLEEEPGGKENPSALSQWSPFGPPGALPLNSEVPSFNAFSTFADNKATPSFDNLLSEADDTVSKRTETSELENNVFDSQFHVRKDGQKTYSSRPHHKSEKSVVLVSRTVETCDNSQAMSGEKSQENASECISATEAKSLLKNDDILLSQIEEGGISRKRKCELRLTRLTASELKAASPRKRWKKQS